MRYYSSSLRVIASLAVVAALLGAGPTAAQCVLHLTPHLKEGSSL